MKWAIIGCGNISKRFCEDLSNVYGATILTIASKNPQKLKIFGEKYKVSKQKRFNDYEAILNTDFDIAYVGLINSLHKKIIKIRKVEIFFRNVLVYPSSRKNLKTIRKEVLKKEAKSIFSISCVFIFLNNVQFAR